MQKTDDNIQELLKRYMDGVCSKEEESTVRSWLDEHVADSRYDKVFERILDETAPDYDEDSFRRSYTCLESFMDIDQKVTGYKSRKRWLYFSAAAVVAAAVIAVAAFFADSMKPVQWHEIYVERGDTQRMELPDGTRLWINSDSKVIYPSDFTSSTRTIYIDGEVYADVTPDKKKPFIMSASGINVKVHGTRFSVKAFAEMDNVEVALISGSVTMEDSNHENGFSRTLIPGELIRYNKTLGTLENYSINPATYGAWQNNHNIRFINQSLKEIAEDLERRFDVNILIEDSTLAKTQYYASFINNEGLDKILQALNSNGSMIISRKHDTIVISQKY